jgi:hypothetical protein
MGLLDGVGDVVKGASELTAPLNAPELADAIKAALDGPLGHLDGASGQPGGNPLDALSHLSDVQVDLAPILGALDSPAIEATAESQMNSAQEVIEALQHNMLQQNDVMQGVIENLHANADGVQDGDATVVAATASGDAHASAHQDSDVGTSHVDAAPAHEDVAASDPSASVG